jgi:hypothetical protein
MKDILIYNTKAKANADNMVEKQELIVYSKQYN